MLGTALVGDTWQGVENIRYATVCEIHTPAPRWILSHQRVRTGQKNNPGSF